MNFSQYKLLMTSGNTGIEAMEIDRTDYYSFVRAKIDEGHSQIIISSSIMLHVLRKMFVEKKAKIVSIDFIEDDTDYLNQMNNLIASVNKDRDYFYDLMEELSFLAEQESVEIKNIRIKYRKNEKPIDLSLSVNGLIKAGENENIGGEISFMVDSIWENVKDWI
ncbi:hypothetical protein [Gracilibacillus phocaeensis]|uniref:hypothetical protein n=1 Tax=Gracilibacillus phocaeensis TaxID=2042304 RepID=UPI00102FCC32|nr:hypothetical protein [Gracilibacillus phocaeensis]